MGMPSLKCSLDCSPMELRMARQCANKCMRYPEDPERPLKGDTACRVRG